MLSEEIPVYGLDKELAEKSKAKYDPTREKQAQEFLETVSGEKLPFPDDFQKSLKDGTLLCKTINNIMTDKPPIKISSPRLPFMQMENIQFFLTRLKELGVPNHDLFSTNDLFEGKNLNQVVDTIFALSRHATSKGYQVPLLGAKLAEKNERKFASEQLENAKNVVPKLYGFHKGASQSGMAIGSIRQVVDPNVSLGDANSLTKLSTMSAERAPKVLGVSMGGKREIGGRTDIELEESEHSQE